MKEELKSKEQLINELAELRQRVAELEASEAERRQAGKLYESIVELAPDSIITLDMKGVITSCNPAATRILGYSKDELIGKHFSKLGVLRARDIPKFLKLFKSALRGELTKPLELGFRRKDGTSILTEVRVGLLKKNGKTIGLQAISTDITERKRMEEALRGSEQRLSTTLRSIGDAVIATDAQGIVTLMNPVAEDLTGWDEAEAVGKPLEDVFNIINEQTGERAENPVARVIREGVVVGLANHTVLIAKDGTKRPIADSGAPMRDEEGNIIGTVMVFRDITERVRAEEALRVSEERFALAVRGSNAGLWDWDIQNNSLYWSARLKELLGYADDEFDVDFDTFESHLHPDDREHTGAAIEAHLKDRGLYDVEQRLRTKSGEYRWFRARGQALWDEAGNPLRMIGFTTDITERKRAEKALRESEEKSRSIVNSSPMGMHMYQLEPDGRLVFTGANPAADVLLGVDNTQFIGKTIEEAFPPLAETEVPEKYRLAASKGEPWQTEQIEYEDEQIKGAFEVRAFQTSPGRMVAMFLDISERKRAEEALKEYSERLEEMVEKRTKELRDAQEQLVRREKLAVLGQLAGGVGHELRNPLGVISNAVYYLQLTLPDVDETTADAREYLDIISEEVRNSTKIISDLLDFSRTRMPNREEIAVSELAAQVLEKHPPPENVEVITHIAPNLPPVFVDPRQMGQVLGNLVANAYQAMKEGGKLTISAQAEESQVSISVGDTGCGIPPENLAKIFEPLFTTKARGIGLGLAVSRSLVEANGGSMEVTSEVGKSSTFTVRLPLAGGRGDT